jgi:hypothetical protein
MDLVSAFIGAAIAVVAQWFITPRVERRIRTHERWEQDVLDLGRLLAFDLPPAREGAYWAWYEYFALFQAATENGLDIDDDETVAVEEQRLRHDARRLFEQWEQTLLRLEWLTSGPSLK